MCKKLILAKWVYLSNFVCVDKVNASTKTILVTFFWGLFWGLFFIWRLFWRLFIQKIVAKLKIVSKIVFKQKINLKITIWANSHHKSPGRCVHLKEFISRFEQNLEFKKTDSPIFVQIGFFDHFHELKFGQFSVSKIIHHDA